MYICNLQISLFKNKNIQFYTQNIGCIHFLNTGIFIQVASAYIYTWSVMLCTVVGIFLNKLHIFVEII